MFPNFLTEKINEQAKAIEAQKINILVDRIISWCAVETPFDLTKESQRMFPRLKFVSEGPGKYEKWYWNDGSESGLLLITFITDINFDSYKNKIDITLTYK